LEVQRVGRGLMFPRARRRGRMVASGKRAARGHWIPCYCAGGAERKDQPCLQDAELE